MGLRFNADEVFAMAERIEENGAAFYRRAAELQRKTSPENVALLTRLAEMEAQHMSVFALMRAEAASRMKPEEAFDPYVEAALYLQGAADSHGGEGTPRAADSLTGRETMPEILRLAIGLEEKSVVFYLGMRDMVPPDLGKDRIDRIIGEEKGHIVALAGVLRRLAGG